MPRSVRSSRWLFVPACFALVLLVWCVSQQPAFAQHRHQEGKKDFKREVESLEEQWRVAQLAEDVPTMDKMLSEDYVGISINGQVNTKTQQLDRTRNRTLVITKMGLSDMKVKLVGSIAIVTSLAEVEGTNEGTSMTGTYRYIRVYQRLPGGIWKITNFEATLVHKRMQDRRS